MLLGILPGLSGQYINIVCTGDTEVVYRVEGTEGSTFDWIVEGGQIVFDWGDSIMVNWGEREGEYEVRVQEFSQYGCPAIPKTGTVLVSAPPLELGEDIELCQGQSFEIDPPGDFESYLWHNGTNYSTFVASEEGYKRVTVTDEYGCPRTDSLYVTIHPLPIVELGPDTVLCGTEELSLDAGMDGVNFSWSTGETFRDITVYEGAQTIWVAVTDANGCISRDTIEIAACSPEDRFKAMPTAFTPNGDGDNDVWRIPELLAYPAAVVEIYDRWGKLVLRSAPGYSDPWDGISMDGREMPMDSYYFVINLGDGVSEPIVGTVTLIK